MDAIGFELEPDVGLFLRQDGDWKVGKNARSRYVKLFADTLADPSIVRLIDKDGQAMDELAVFGHYIVRRTPLVIKLAYRWTGKAWEGWSAFQFGREQALQSHISAGFPIYVRKR